MINGECPIVFIGGAFQRLSVAASSDMASLREDRVCLA
jgi:hypothetical protein